MARVFDGFTFFNELDVLELRLRELSSLVDRFVLVEADHTFTGNPKPLHFDENKERFSEFADKIEHIIVRDMPGDDASAWDREFFQRNAIARGLGDAGPDDFVIVGDVDEIPKPHAVREALANPASARSLITFAPEFYLYYLNLITSPVYVSTVGPRMIKRRYLKSPQVLRAHKPRWRKRSNAFLSDLVVGARIRSKFGAFLKNRVIERGAWHFTFLGGAEAIKKKLTSYSHTEVLNDNLLDEAYLQDMLDRRQFIFEGDMKLEVLEDFRGLPETLRRFPDTWRHHLLENTRP